jgi:ribosome-binding ATPase YchF (GTP1/OBG family)
MPPIPADWNAIPIDAKLEAELNALSEPEKKAYLKELGLELSGLDRLIQTAYQKLGLITFFTTGPDETRAWTVKTGSTAPIAAGKIHTDFQRGFIKAETINWQKLLQASSWAKAKELGLVRTEGKEYIVHDGDVMIFKFNV